MKTRFATTIVIISLWSNAYAGSSPTIAINPTSTIYLNLSNKSASGVINDPTDPLATIGIDFLLTDEDPSTVIFTSSSNKTSVIPNSISNIIISGTGNKRNVRIIPKGIGYATITFTAKDNESKTTTYKIDFAISASAIVPAKNHYFTHLSSASTAIAIDNDYMIIGDDEYNELSIYNRNQSGWPIASFDPTTSLKLPDASTTEVDIEASCISPTKTNRTYWMGSMSNSKSGDQKPNRDRIFAMDKSGVGAKTILSFVGYTSLRSKVIAWGDSYGYNLTASTKTGVTPKQIDGFSLEGLEFGPDNTTLFLGFRTPFVPTTKRTKALICPIANFETWFNNGTPSGSPSLGIPIELDLGGRGIRSIAKNTTNQYIIVAGAFDGTDDFALFKWTGKATDSPILLTANLTGLNPEGIVEVPTSVVDGTEIELVNDHGSAVWYNDSNESKDLTTVEFQKFATTWVNLVFPITTMLSTYSENEIKPIFPVPVITNFNISYTSDKNETLVVYIADMTGAIVSTSTHKVNIGVNQLDVHCQELRNGSYLLYFEGKGLSPYKFVKK